MTSPVRRSASRAGAVMGVAAAVLIGGFFVPETLELPTAPPRTSTGEESPSAPIDRVAVVCPGPEQQGLPDAAVEESDQRVDIDAVSAPQEIVEAALLAAEYRGAATDLTQGSLSLEPLAPSATGPENASVAERGVSATLSLTTAHGAAALATDGLAPGVSATQMYSGQESGQAGLALTPCVSASDEVWLVAGGAERGRSERLVVMNPGQSAIAASVQVWGSEADPVGDVGEVSVALEPGEREVMLIDALAPAEAAPVVRVVSTGGPISAYLGDRALDGTTDLGWELTAPVASPTTSNVIPSVVIPASDPAQQESLGAKVRVAVVGPDPAVVEITAWGPQGAVPLAQGVRVVPGQRSADIGVSDLAPGTYTLAITSDVDIVASASLPSTMSTSGHQDFAWAASAPAVGPLAGAPLPQPAGGAQVLYSLDLVALDGGGATVFTRDDGGEIASVDIELDPEMVSTTALRGAAGVWVVPNAGEVFASVRGSAELLPAADEATDRATSTAAPPDQAVATQARLSSPVSLTSVFALSNLDLIRSVAAISPALP